MYPESRTLSRLILLCAVAALVLTISLTAQAQNSVSASQPKPAISILDSTKEQDGLIGSVRRVKTESAKIEFKDGQQVEGPLQLLELTTYGIKGNRIENTSYPSGDSQVGKEEYKYDDKGNIIEMTLRNDNGGIISREAYSYTFDNFGNWTKMITSLVVFEDGQLKREPVEVTYRTLTYYFDDSIAKITDAPAPRIMPNAPTSFAVPPTTVSDLKLDLNESAKRDVSATFLGTAGTPPELRPKPAEVNKPSSVWNARKDDGSRSGVATTSESLAVKATTGQADSNNSTPTVERAAEPEKREKPNSSSENSSASNQPVARLVTVLKPTTAAASQKTAFEYFQSGRAHFDSGDMKAAVDDFLKSINLEPRSAEVYLNLANAYLKLDKDKEALNAFKQSVKLKADDAEAQYGLGLCSFRMNRFRDAVDGFKKATKLDPKMAKAHYGLGLAYQELGEQAFLMDEYRVLENLDKSLAKRLAQTLPQIDFSCRGVQLCH